MSTVAISTNGTAYKARSAERLLSTVKTMKDYVRHIDSNDPAQARMRLRRFGQLLSALENRGLSPHAGPTGKERVTPPYGAMRKSIDDTQVYNLISPLMSGKMGYIEVFTHDYVIYKTTTTDRNGEVELKPSTRLAMAIKFADHYFVDGASLEAMPKPVRELGFDLGSDEPARAAFRLIKNTMKPVLNRIVEDVSEAISKAVQNGGFSQNGKSGEVKRHRPAILTF